MPGVTAPLTVEERIARANVPVSFFELCARGNGKTFELLILAIETAIKTKDARILYVAPLRDDAEKIAKDLIELFILLDCPKELRPEWKAGEGEYVFPNGSTIRFRGTNNDSVERLRGFGYHLVILDECGVMDRLRYVVGIIRPLAERMKGKVILATTPAETPDHESTDLYREHSERGAAVVFTILDNPRLTWDEKATILLNENESPHDIEGILAGTKSPVHTNTLRERFCRFVTDAGKAVLPEWTDDVARSLTVRVGTDRKIPEYFDAYEALDPGIVNQSAILFGYYDFERGVIVVQAEKFLRGKDANYNGIADAVEASEITLWGSAKWAGGRAQPTRRVIDPDTRLEMDLQTERHLRFEHAQKHDSDGGIRLIRTLITGKQLEVDSSCRLLLQQMQMAIWNKNATDFATEKDGGHYDGLAALKYFVRAVDRNKNPFPEGYRTMKDPQGLWRPPEKPNTGLLPSTPWGRKVAAHWKRAR